VKALLSSSSGRRDQRGCRDREEISEPGPPGVSGENNYAGAVSVFPGGSTRPTATGSELFTASSVGLAQPYGTVLGGDGLLWII
jgi:hypothetical protein